MTTKALLANIITLADTVPNATQVTEEASLLMGITCDAYPAWAKKHGPAIRRFLVKILDHGTYTRRQDRGEKANLPGLVINPFGLIQAVEGSRCGRRNPNHVLYLNALRALENQGWSVLHACKTK